MRRRRKEVDQQDQEEPSKLASEMRRRPAKMSLRLLTCNFLIMSCFQVAAGQQSGLRFNQDSNSYSGLTFTFDPRLDKRGLEWLHFEHWLSIMQSSSALLYDSLNGRAHLNEVRVLIPYKWRSFEWPVIHKPGIPIIQNRHLLYRDSDVIVGFEDPVYKETPYSVQHDECSRPGLNIRMPISFLEQQQSGAQENAKLKARLLVREFASHRFGVFKESGFRNDPMYPPFASLAGLSLHNQSTLLQRAASRLESINSTGNIRGFDENWNECAFETSPASGLPQPQSMSCAPYLVRAPTESSFNLMSADPFSYKPVSPTRGPSQQQVPLSWRDISESAKWHFCGDNFPALNGPVQLIDANSKASSAAAGGNRAAQLSHPHNQLTINKQNIMCNERSAMDIIKQNEDFKRNSASPSTFNRLPETNFKFMQEMPPRIILAVEYSAHLYQTRRLDHNLLEAAIGKFLAYDLIADSEFGLILFNQVHSIKNSFKKLDSSVNSRLTYYSPPIDPFDEPPKYYSDQELAQMDILVGQQQSAAKIIKGTCSFAKVMSEAMSLQQQKLQLYDDVGTDTIIITSGLFIEDEQKIEEILKQTYLKLSNQQLHLIVYPSTMLFDTKSKDSYIVLNALESELVIKSRLAKLNLIQRLTKAKIHLIKEHLDSNGAVKMSTLMQFHQVFDFISKGHSWDQTQSMVTLSQQLVEAKQEPSSTQSQQQPVVSLQNNYKLQFQFEVDQSLENGELIVGFIDPKMRNNLQLQGGKRFSIKNLQLRSPGGHLFLTDQHPFPISAQHQQNSLQQQLRSHESMTMQNDEALAAEQDLELASQYPSSQLHATSSPASEAALFPYRSQLSLAGFHLRASHLAQLNSTNHRLAGLWTLSATSDEPIQTNGIAMAQVDPNGDSVTANCWIQSYHDNSEFGGALKQVKVFAQVKGSAHYLPIKDVQARLEIQDEMGNIVQNVQMLDDGLGSPDMTKGDGILSQYVQKAYKPGHYKATIELNGLAGQQDERAKSSPSDPSVASASKQQNSLGQDNACCGSLVPNVATKKHDTRHLSRQLYCGTFHVDQHNRLNQLRPPRVNNLTIVNVDHENKKVTIRWFEPMIELMQSFVSSAKLQEQQETQAESEQAPNSQPLRVVRKEHHQLMSDDVEMMLDHIQKQQSFTGRSLMKSQENFSPLNNRYEIRLFDDRDIMRRSFELAKSPNDVGYKFNDLSIDGMFQNASIYGGMKELTLRLPMNMFNRLQQDGGIYYMALKVHNNNLEMASPMSNVAQFYIRNLQIGDNLENFDQSQLDQFYGLETTVDSLGNVYDKNTGQLIHRINMSNGGQNNVNGFAYSLLKSTTGDLNGLNVLICISIMAFVFSILFISLIVCLASSAFKTLQSKSRHSKHDDKKAVTLSTSSSNNSNNSNNSSSSIVGSDSGGNQSDLGSVLNVNGNHDIDILNSKAALQNHYAMNEDSEHISNYNNLQHVHYQQQQQAELIQSQLQTYQQPIAHDYQAQQDFNQQQWQPQHTVINGYAYATVSNQANLAGLESQQQQQTGTGLNQQQSWPADILLSHYDKVKQARQRNEAPPVMRVDQFDEAGLQVDSGQQDNQTQHQSYLVSPSYFNQQLQQQLSSVLKSKQQQQRTDPDKSSPALEGLTDEQQFGVEQGLILPPPQYSIYAQTGHQDPSIYSQVTNLQQVVSSSSLTNSTEAASYYANQPNINWHQKQLGADQQQSPSYGQYQQQQQMDASNSAISEV